MFNASCLLLRLIIIMLCIVWNRSAAQSNSDIAYKLLQTHRWKATEIHYDSTLAQLRYIKLVALNASEDTLKKHPSWFLRGDSLYIRYFERADAENQIVVLKHGPFYKDVAHYFNYDAQSQIITIIKKLGKKKPITLRYYLTANTNKTCLLLERLRDG